MDTRLRPPQAMIDFVGAGDFEAVGTVFLKYLEELGGLRPHHRVLDVGCGCGRIAIPLTGFLGAEGSYEGFDIYEEGIQWCTDNIHAVAPNFRFRLVDVYNERYNKKGKTAASAFRFPYDSGSFDFVMASSVLTHLQPKDMMHYLSEISRVLKSGGMCLITYFLFNELGAGAAPNRNGLDFQYAHGSYRTVSDSEPEHAISFDETFLRDLYRSLDLRIKEPITYGFQDIVVAEKVAAWKRILRVLGVASILRARIAARLRRAREGKLRRVELGLRRARSFLGEGLGALLARVGGAFHRAVSGFPLGRSQRPAPAAPPAECPEATAPAGIPNGLWSDAEGRLHMLIQTYDTGECIVLVTVDARRFVGFRGTFAPGSVRFDNDAGGQGCTLEFEVTDPTRGNLSATLPFGDFHVPVILVAPASSQA